MPKRRVMLALVLLLSSAALLLHTLLSPEGWARREQVRADLDAMRAENARLEAEVETLGAQINALRTRPEVQERVVRDELGYTRPGEVSLEIPPTP